LDAHAGDLVETGDRFFFAMSDVEWPEAHLVRSRLNHNGEGHSSREVALAHLDNLREMEESIRQHINRVNL
jgi:hypothetical protein